MITDSEIHLLKELQDLHYRCAFGSDYRVSFWVESSKDEDDSGMKCYLGGIAYVPATEDCLRDDIKNNAVSPHKRREGKRKRQENDLPKCQQDEARTGELSVAPPKRFFLRTLENWKERVRQICRDWIQDSHHWAERAAKRHLVDKLEDDLSKHAIVWEQNSRREAAEEVDYDRHRQVLHSALFLDCVNKLGNGMIAWYNQDLRLRSSSCLRFGRDNDGAGGYAGGSGPNGFYATRAESPEGETGVDQSNSRDHSFGNGNTSTCGMNSDDRIDNDVEDESDSMSFWTESTSYYDPSTCATSLMLDESTNIGSENISIQTFGLELPIPLPPSATEPMPTFEAKRDSGSGREAESCRGRDGSGREDLSGKRVTALGQVDCPSDKRKPDIPIRYGETRRYWQSQAVLKEKTPFLPWQRVAFHKGH